MKLSAAVLTVLGAAAGASAWITTPPSSVGRRSSSSAIATAAAGPLFASRGAAKWERKKAWLASRGVADDDDSDSGGDSSSSSPSEGGFVTVVGGGRIGGLLATGGDHLLLGRGDSIPADNEGTPILLATRNDALDSIIDSCPPNRLGDLVFLQNGYLDDFLTAKGLLENTQVLLYLSVTAKGADAVDGVTTVNPEGLTAATGVHAEAFAKRLAALELKCRVVSAEEYRPAMFEKLIWISTYMLVGTAKECASVGEAGSTHKDTVEAVITELIAAVSAKEGISFPSGAVERLAAYTDVVADFPCAVKEFEWRNQYFYKLGDGACPVHNGLLRECLEKGLLGFELP